MWTFIKSATDETNWLKGHPREVCFIGRSNVGKSSLINALSKNKKLAKISQTPGKTKLINFFQEDKRIYVDLPGYGYTRMSKGKQHEMFDMIENYIENREELVKIFLLVDSKIGPTKDDREILKYLSNSGKQYMVIMTKSDKPNQSELHKSKLMVEEIVDDYLVISSKKGTNIDKLNRLILKEF